MNYRATFLRVWIAATVVVAALAAQVALDLPARLSDQEFWSLSQALSEPDGAFRSDNLMSNETGLQRVLPALVERLESGGVYLGVGPEQNFTYIAALRPKIAFIIDIRSGNRNLHLMYKALFEMAADRAEFVSLLFSRPRPAGLSASSTVGEIFAAYQPVASDEALYRRNSSRIREWLVQRRGLPLTDAELDGVQYVYDNFYRFGPGLNYSSSTTGRGDSGTTYARVMQTTDANGEFKGYLASEPNFAVVKDLETRNLLVPIIGDFAGPKAIRAVGDWLRARGAIVSAFYLSNVEDYLRRDTLQRDFCGNVATLPLDARSTFIRSGRSGFAALQPAFPPAATPAQPAAFPPGAMPAQAVPPPAPVPPVPPATAPPQGPPPPPPSTPTQTMQIVEYRLDGPIIRTVQIATFAPMGLGPGNYLGLITEEIKACSPQVPAR